MPHLLQLNNITFAYETGSTLFHNLNVTFRPGWTGIAGANGSGKSTLLKLICRELEPQTGTLRLITPGQEGLLLSVPQECGETSSFSEEIEAYQDALYDGSGTAHRWMGLLEVGYDWFDRLDSLSYGERRRLQLAAALRQEPDCLCLDEPVNHLDEKARRIISQALMQYRGIGLLVSHDRSLLNELPQAVLLLSHGDAVLRRGNYRQVMEEQEKLALHSERAREKARQEVKKLEAEASKRRALAASQQKRRSKKNLDIKDSDGRSKMDLVRVSGKDSTGGKLLRQMDGRLRQAHDRLEQSQHHRADPTGITIRGTQGRRDFLWRQGSSILRFGGSDQGDRLILPDLEIRPRDRIALAGRNGYGKSTLIRRILEPGGLEGVQTLYLPQEFTAPEREELHHRFSVLNHSAKGEVLSAVARLGSDPVAVRDSRNFSPGEARKVFLAMALYSDAPPELLILDEPENHLDLPAVRFLEEALSGYQGALLLVSHDREFRDKLTGLTWEILAQGEDRILKHSS